MLRRRGLGVALGHGAGVQPLERANPLGRKLQARGEIGFRVQLSNRSALPGAAYQSGRSHDRPGHRPKYWLLTDREHIARDLRDLTDCRGPAGADIERLAVNIRRQPRSRLNECITDIVDIDEVPRRIRVDQAAGTRLSNPWRQGSESTGISLRGDHRRNKVAGSRREVGGCSRHKRCSCSPRPSKPNSGCWAGGTPPPTGQRSWFRIPTNFLRE